MDAPVNVPIDNPNADTEWNDILRKHGVIPEKPPSPTPIIQEAILKAREEAHDKRLEDKDLAQLRELEDDEDDAFLEKYRHQRMQELQEVSKASVYGQVFHLQKPDYSRDVTEASAEAFVLVGLTSSLGNNHESRLLTEIWRELAPIFGDVKFCEMKADLCIEGYPEHNTPTILIYRAGDIKKQVVTFRELRSDRTSSRDLVTLLVDIGAVQRNDPRLKGFPQGSQSNITYSADKPSALSDDDDEWD